MTSGNVLASFTRTMGKQDSLSLSFESLTAALKDILNSLSLSLFETFAAAAKRKVISLSWRR
jgi:hypothetical protein